jgi:glucose-1-phosphate thymidylyltransferase
VIPAAGRATRLGRLAAGRPKALLDLGGKPVIEHLLDRLSAPFSGACVVTGPDDVDDLRGLLGDRHGQLNVCYEVQPEPAGVAEAVCRAEGRVDGPFTVVMGDCYFDAPLSDLPVRWAETGGPGAVLVEPAGPQEEQPMGLVAVDGTRVSRIFKDVWTGQTKWRVCGAFLLPHAFFDEAARTPVSSSGEYELEDVVMRLIERGASFEAIPYRGWRRNINTPADLGAVRSRLMAQTGEGDGHERPA